MQMPYDVVRSVKPLVTRSGKPIRPLWELLDHRLLTWWEMEETYGGVLPHALDILAHLECEISKVPAAGDASFSRVRVLAPEQRNEIVNALEFVESVFFKAGLAVSGKSVSIIRLWLSYFNGNPPCEETLNRLRKARSTVQDEMESVILMVIRPEHAWWYQSPERNWEQAVARWPKIRIDVEEMGRCFACDRYAGAIFHALLIAEFGLIQVCDLFQCSGDKPGWACLERLQRIRDKGAKERTELENKHFKLLEETLPLLQSVKDSWRHKISHVDNRLVWLDTDFSSQLAEEIIFATRGLMRRLAQDLPTARAQGL